MKKLLGIIIPLVILLVSCSGKKRMDITKLTYVSIDYNGGYTTTCIIDFGENVYRRYGYLYGVTEEPELKVEKYFTEEEGIEFITGINNCGIMGIKKEYKKTGIIDGGGWNLTIEFEDGTDFKSKGSNAGPKKVFNKCAYCFYDLCGEGVVGMVSEFYTNPPTISHSFSYRPDSTTYASSNAYSKVQLGNYKWNKWSVENTDYYLMNEESKEESEFIKDYSYKLVLYTANYYYEVRFNKIEVFEFDFNSELSNKKTIYSGGWFKQIEMDISFNKIYLYRLSYKDGNYSEFTFNTHINE